MATKTRRKLNLALQGGGAHGAFAWGVLDRLLEDGRIEFEGVTAASAGSMNGVVLAHGLTEGGPEGARQALHDFWHRVSEAGRFSPIASSPLDQFTTEGRDPVFTYLLFDMVTRFASPYQFNPFNINPLRNIVDQFVDFERIRQSCAIKLFLSATNVRTGKIRVFKEDEITCDAVMASACLPFLFHAVEIDGEHYWDGGYMGNPAIFPVIYNCESRDVMIIHLNPLMRDDLPTDATTIMNRVNEISFNSSLMREMRAIAFITDLVENDHIRGRAVKRMLIHTIGDDELMVELGVASKLNPEWTFLTDLRDKGREAAGQWLDAHYTKLGKRSSVDIREVFL